MSEYIEQQKRLLEDRFIDLSEKAINQGKSFDEAFVSGTAEAVNYRLSPEWKQRYEQMEERARPFRQVRKAWSADTVRKEVADLRKARTEAAADEGFYLDNKHALTELVRAGKDFPHSGLPKHLEPYYRRAQEEVLGYVPEDAPEPLHDPFITGFGID